MMKRNFKEWLSKFKCSISSYDYYVDFEKVVEKNKNLQLKELEFYYHLYFDCDKTKMPGMAINNFWKTFFTKSL